MRLNQLFWIMVCLSFSQLTKKACDSYSAQFRRVFESSLEMLCKNDMQGFGLCQITYARRYSLASMLNIAQADDDANEASKQTKKAPTWLQGFWTIKSILIRILSSSVKMAGKNLVTTVDDHIGMMSWLDGESKEKSPDRWRCERILRYSKRLCWI